MCFKLIYRIPNLNTTFSLGRQDEERILQHVFWEFERQLGWTAAAMLPKQARGTSRKHVTKHFTQPAAPDCSVFREQGEQLVGDTLHGGKWAHGLWWARGKRETDTERKAGRKAEEDCARARINSANSWWILLKHGSFWSWARVHFNADLEFRTQIALPQGSAI